MSFIQCIMSTMLMVCLVVPTAVGIATVPFHPEATPIHLDNPFDECESWTC